jgi:hypothetical protein
MNVINPVHIFINSGPPEECQLKSSGYLFVSFKFIGDPLPGTPIELKYILEPKDLAIALRDW